MPFVTNCSFLPPHPYRRRTEACSKPPSGLPSSNASGARIARREYPATKIAVVSCETTAWPDAVFVLSSDEAKAIVHALKDAGRDPSLSAHQVSIDLGTKRVPLEIVQDAVRLMQVQLSLGELDHIGSSRDGAWLIYPDGTSSRIATHGEHAPVSLHPVEGSAPTVVIGGFGMHRFARDVNPISDTLAKIDAARPTGRVLDICTGLGYTAIRAAELPEVTSVVTVERDFSVLSVAKANPWSGALFSSDKIVVLHGDAADIVENTFQDGEFDTIIHDPPALAFSGDLYSGKFYKSLRRICSNNGGKLFHYIGNPNSKESGRLFKGIAKRLTEAGFNGVETAEDAFGIVASVGAVSTSTRVRDARGKNASRGVASRKNNSGRRR